MNTSPLDSPLVNRRAQKKFGMNAAQLLDAHERGQLTDPKAVKMAQAIERELDRHAGLDAAQARIDEREPGPAWRPWLLWLIPIACIVLVLISTGGKLPF